LLVIITDGLSSTDSKDIDRISETLFSATQSALRERLAAAPDQADMPLKEYIQTCFKSAWIGLAGIDRSGFREALIPKVSELFGLPAGKELRLTNDVDLLAAAMEQHPVAASAVVAIAGTGSVAMRYARMDGSYVRVARSGGWGHILGDEGGGYAIGLQAIKHTLTSLEERKLGLRQEPLGELEKKVLTHLGCADPGDGNIDLLSELLVQNRTQSLKSRIAGVAEVVLNTTETEKTAAAIVDSQARFFVEHTLGRLVDPKCGGYAPSEESGLILSGSIMKNSTYRASILTKLADKGASFKYVETVNDAVSTGASVLATKLTQNGA
jgi:N-acetylmuramic acid 6-phosphate etherase